MDRKALKSAAKTSLKLHYRIFVFVCLLSMILGIGHSITVATVRSVLTVEAGPSHLSRDSFLSDMLNSFFGSEGKQDGQADKEELLPRKYGALELGDQGVLGSTVKFLTSGNIFTAIYRGIVSIVNSGSGARAIMIFLVLLIYGGIWAFFCNTFNAVWRRIFLEARIYKNVPAKRMMFLVRVKRWTKVSLSLLLKDLFLLLWSLTVVGGIIKRYSYYMVPYILAENPDTPARDAINLSRKMMYGHKWECFKLELSFIGWFLLEILTLGLVGIFYSSPYIQATFAEYYVKLRQEAIDQKAENCDYFNDRYLFETPSNELLAETYNDVKRMIDNPVEPPVKRTAIGRFFAKVFGVVLYYDKEEIEYREHAEEKKHIKLMRRAMHGEAYPSRLSPLTAKKRTRKLFDLQYNRRYSLCTLIVIFFTASTIGWLWEVGMHIVMDGRFVNRGVLHGPWLPIYGFGCLIIMLVLNKLRSRPFLLFLTTVILCGVVEYSTALILKHAFNAQWWDYTGYFLNINGLVCAEGLLLFGIGGMFIVYFVAPLIDNLVMKIKQKPLAIVCAVLSIICLADFIISGFIPNTGKGVSNYKPEHPPYVEQNSTENRK